MRIPKLAFTFMFILVIGVVLWYVSPDIPMLLNMAGGSVSDTRVSVLALVLLFAGIFVFIKFARS